MVCNAIMSAGMAHMAELIEGGLSHRDAVAKVLWFVTQRVNVDSLDAELLSSAYSCRLKG